MNTQNLSTFGGLKALLICGAVFYIGLWLTKSHDTVIVWIGVIFSCLAALSTIRVFFSFASSSFRRAKQYQFSLYAHTPSDALGDAKLADENSPIVRQLSQNKNGIFLGAYLNLLLFFDPFSRGNAHWMIYARARSGKTSCVITPTALHWFGGSLFMPSIKGDTVAIAKAIREKRGHRFIIWNPFNVLELKGVKINPLQILVDDARCNNGVNLQALSLLIANTLAPKSQKEENPFFRNGAIRLLTGHMIFLAVLRPWECHLPGLNKLVWASDEERAEITALMKAHEGAHGLVKKYGGHLSDLFKPEYLKTFGPMRDIAIEATMIYDAGTPFGKSLMGNDFSLEDMLDQKTTFSPIIPEEKLIPFGQSIGLISALLFEKLAALKAPTKLLVLLDEAGNFGNIPNMAKAMTLLPEKGLRVCLAFQSRNQLTEIYGENQAAYILKQCSGVQEWSISDVEEAKRWSARAGDYTLKTYNMNFNPADPEQPWKPAVSEKPHPALNPYEILTLGKNKQLIAINNSPVITCDLVAYFEINDWRNNAAPNPYHSGGYPKDKPVKYDLRG